MYFTGTPGVRDFQAGAIVLYIYTVYSIYFFELHLITVVWFSHPIRYLQCLAGKNQDLVALKGHRFENNKQLPYLYHPCMLYLPTFIIRINQM